MEKEKKLLTDMSAGIGIENLIKAIGGDKEAQDLIKETLVSTGGRPFYVTDEGFENGHYIPGGATIHKKPGT
jgi:hypothetical protein